MREAALLAVEFTRRSAAVGDPPARHRHAPGAVGCGDRAIDRAVAVPAPPISPLVPLGGQDRCKLLFQRDVQCLANVSPKLRFDLLTKLQIASSKGVSSMRGYARMMWACHIAGSRSSAASSRATASV